MATFADYDEEQRLIGSFGGDNVSWQGDSWAVRFEGTMWRVPRGVVRQYGIIALRRGMHQKANPMLNAIASLDSATTTREAEDDE